MTDRESDQRDAQRPPGKHGRLQEGYQPTAQHEKPTGPVDIGKPISPAPGTKK